jgi:hypothetical protein
MAGDTVAASSDDTALAIMARFLGLSPPRPTPVTNARRVLHPATPLIQLGCFAVPRACHERAASTSRARPATIRTQASTALEGVSDSPDTATATSDTATTTPRAAARPSAHPPAKPRPTGAGRDEASTNASTTTGTPARATAAP